MAKKRVYQLDLVLGGGKMSDPERPGKSTWPHVFCLEIGHPEDVAVLVQQATAWLARRVEGRDPAPFVYQGVGQALWADEESADTFEVALGKLVQRGDADGDA